MSSYFNDYIIPYNQRKIKLLFLPQRLKKFTVSTCRSILKYIFQKLAKLLPFFLLVKYYTANIPDKTPQFQVYQYLLVPAFHKTRVS